jgi:hypothetical protein
MENMKKATDIYFETYIFLAKTKKIKKAPICSTYNKANLMVEKMSLYCQASCYTLYRNLRVL